MKETKDHTEISSAAAKPAWYRSLWLVLVLGIVVGVLGLLTVRFVSYKPEHVHYHANFAVYLNGVRDEFKGTQYYQEVAICSASRGITIPQQRAHMHDNINSVIHVHDHATTWGQFFENLGWTVGPNFVQTDDGTMYASSGDAKLHILLNGQDYTDLSPITNVIIKDQARLLISFGAVQESTLQQEFKTVPNTAGHYDR
jgi:predicted lactoylglutathione lyase